MYSEKEPGLYNRTAGIYALHELYSCRKTRMFNFRIKRSDGIMPSDLFGDPTWPSTRSVAKNAFVIAAGWYENAINPTVKQKPLHNPYNYARKKPLQNPLMFFVQFSIASANENFKTLPEKPKRAFLWDGKYFKWIWQLEFFHWPEFFRWA